MNFVDRLVEFQKSVKAANRSVPRITVAVSERYARRMLGLPKDAALVYNDVPLRCIGSKAWRARQAEQADQERWAAEFAAKHSGGVDDVFAIDEEST